MVDSRVVSATFPLGSERHSYEFGRTKFVSSCLSFYHGGQLIVQRRPRPSSTTAHEATTEAAGSSRLDVMDLYRLLKLTNCRTFFEEYGATCLSPPSPQSRKARTRAARVNLSLIVIVATAF